MMVVVLVVIKAGIAIMVLTNGQVGVVMTVAHNIMMVHDIQVPTNSQLVIVTTVAHNIRVSVVMKPAPGLVIFNNHLERTQTPPSL